jgi:hypothetical protein
MFRPAVTHIAERIAEILDDALIGDFDYISDGEALYADIDYYRKHPHRLDLRTAIVRRQCNAETVAPAALTRAGLRSRA